MLNSCCLVAQCELTPDPAPRFKLNCIYEQSMKTESILASAICLFSALAGCTHAPVAPVASVPAGPTGEPLDITPEMQHYRMFSVVPLATSRTGTGEMRGRLAFNADAAAIEMYDAANGLLGRLFIAPESCRNDDSPDCVRRYAMSGQLADSADNLRCYVQIRNDTKTGYAGQALTGICRDNAARMFEIKLFGDSQ
jgi:hypothetical protein